MSSLRKKVYATIIIALFCLIIVTGIGNYRAEQLAIKIAADQIDKALALTFQELDNNRLQTLIQTLDDQDPYYDQIRILLRQIKQDHNLADLAILYKIPETGWFYVVDAREKEDPSYHPLGAAEKQASVYMERTWKEQPAGIEYQASSSNAFISRYLLLKDAQGSALAVLKGDLAAGDITSYLYKTRYVQIGVIIVSLVLIGLITGAGYKKTKVRA
ncbi:MAG: hypothetical protein GX091_06420 [Peptococcaceae bacterium]|nr:hypothetical protein [Peptococcaceae bacterium]